MNLNRNPELLDRLAASYSLGTLHGGARRRFEQLAREYPQVRAAALLWQGRWSAFSEVQVPVQPDAVVWTRIANLVDADKADTRIAQQREAAVPRSSVRALAWWRGLALAGGMAAVAAVSVGLWSHQGLREASQQQLSALQTQLQLAQAALQATPQIRYVAVLADGQADASMLVTFDPRHNQLVLQRVSGFKEAENKSLQLWALPQQGAPRSLGVMGDGRLEQLTAQENDMTAIPALAISLEPKGGVPSSMGPTGPVLFKGALIRRDL
ncbi:MULTISPECIES: anti-sigma factor [Comamonas]|jgi:anti-sigma-K factor RskA|uniref:anti-sigma factor n=1 Tax=Comamonas TaxID=283 RepID=UPI0012C32E8F|nr:MULTISPECIES: anti-sigma factor [Comamonas]MDR3065243.1 anti-sigma factor [Comamonas sp.]MEB5963651.1 anti-sigma factor [Comamonas testosteroni]MPS94211.1 RNA polymerase subunit sigma-70 [Comamonas sp.]